MDEMWRQRAHAARAHVIAGELRGAALASVIVEVPFTERDAWVDELLGIPQPPADIALPRGAVPYLPCGVDEILAGVRDTALGPSDVLVDLGAGLGRVLMLAHLLTGARGHGVEIQEPLVAAARATSKALGLATALSFEHADARSVELAGTVFFLYAPFNGELLATVLARLAELATRQAFTVCAVDLELPSAPWVQRQASTSERVAIYRCTGKPC